MKSLGNGWKRAQKAKERIELLEKSSERDYVWHEALSRSNFDWQAHQYRGMHDSSHWPEPNPNETREKMQSSYQRVEIHEYPRKPTLWQRIKAKL